MAAARTVEAPRQRRRASTDPVGLYLEEIGRHPLLTPAGEQVLARSIAEGRAAAERLEALERDGSVPPSERRRLQKAVRDGREAAELFVNANLRLVVSVAKRYQGTGVPLLDLIQEGNLGLIRAVEKFDHEKGFRFSTYAIWWIRQSISRGIASTRSSVRLPTRINEETVRLREMTTQMEQRLGRQPRIAELAEATDLSEERVAELLRLSADTVSLSGAVGSDGDAELGDFLEDPGAANAVDLVASRLLNTEVEEMLSVLDERERRIVALRFGFDGQEPMSVVDVAAHIGLSRERIRQLEHRALAKLMHPSWAAVGRFLVED